jgi:glycosyltransferase involved in cell wall biosynthesis
MRINLLRPIEDEGRVSMEVYADALAAELGMLLEPGDTVREVSYQASSNGHGRLPLARYVHRYVGYQSHVRSVPGDIFHILDHGYGHLALSLPPARTVVTFHDAMLLRLAAGELSSSRHPWLAVMGQRLSLYGIRRAARVIVDSECSRDDFLRFVRFDPARVTVVPLGVTNRFRPVDPGPWESRLGPRPRLLHVGHTDFYKNVEGIIRALPLLTARGCSATLVKVGTEFSPKQKKLIHDLGVANCIQHLGHVADDDLPHIYAAADALVAPSFNEGFGLPAIEAMACGTPVVASIRGSHPEVVGDAGILVDPDRPEEIAAGVLRLWLEPGLRQKLVAKGRRRAEGFSWRRTAESTLAVYRQVVKDG